MPLETALLGPLTRDFTHQDSLRWSQPGGAPWHAGLALGASKEPADQVLALAVAGPWSARFGLPGLIASGVGWAGQLQERDTVFRNRYDAVGHTGLPRPELLKGTKGIIAYFNNDKDFLEIVVEADGRQIPLFNEREVLHMRDVKALIQGLAAVQALAVGLAFGYAVYVLLNLTLGRPWALTYLSRALVVGGTGTAALILLVGGIAALGGFQALFLQFHLFSFSNLLWVLDPAQDRLLQMFPESFFFDATMLIAGATLLQALLLVAGGIFLGRRAQRPPPADPVGGPVKGVARPRS